MLPSQDGIHKQNFGDGERSAMHRINAFFEEISAVCIVLLVAALVCCVVATIGFLKQQPASADVTKFNWSKSRCWFEPCSITVLPRLPWERYVYSSIENLRYDGPIEAMAIGPDGAIVVGGSDGVRRSTPPYDRWENLSRRDEFEDARAVALGPDGAVVVVGYDGIRRSTPPYDRWENLSRLDEFEDARAVALGPDGAVVVVGFGGVRRSTPPYDRWENLPRRDEFEDARAVAVGPDGAVVVVGYDGIRRSTPPYDRWENLPRRDEFEDARAVAVGPDGAVVVVGYDGIRRSTPPYDRWENLPRRDEFEDIRAVALGPDGAIVAFGKGVIIHTLVPITSALLIWVVLLVQISALVFALPVFAQAWRRGGFILEVPAPALESDLPIDDPNQTTEATRRVAKRIYRFVRNPDAPAPLTFALVGKWGSGKSTLMKLVERDLRDNRCPCVWFNAWHHQNETHLFAALMESIRLTAVPNSIFGYIEFQLNLVRLRFRRIPVAICLLGLFLILCLSVLIWLGSEIPPISEWYKFIGEFEITKAYKYEQVNVPVVLVFVGLGWLKSRWNPLKAFPVEPANMMRASVAWGLFPRYRDQLSFRHQFGQAFKEVCMAFDDRRLVIVIDDLDRCRPEQVVEILEAVNFLTTSGDCFVLLGIDESQVTRAVGLHYRDIADEMARERQQSQDREGGGGNDEQVQMELANGASKNCDYEDRQTYANHYLEKLINLKIKVPVVDDQDLVHLRNPIEVDQS